MTTIPSITPPVSGESFSLVKKNDLKEALINLRDLFANPVDPNGDPTAVPGSEAFKTKEEAKAAELKLKEESKKPVIKSNPDNFFKTTYENEKYAKEDEAAMLAAARKKWIYASNDALNYVRLNNINKMDNFYRDMYNQLIPVRLTVKVPSNRHINYSRDQYWWDINVRNKGAPFSGFYLEFLRNTDGSLKVLKDDLTPKDDLSLEIEIKDYLNSHPLFPKPTAGGGIVRKHRATRRTSSKFRSTRKSRK
jgi:hypothetical protein